MIRYPILYYTGLIVLMVVSFFLYSSRYYPLLNSDDALNILMIYYYKLPKDIYYWSQDRGGTLIPFISHIFHKLFGMSAVNSVSFTNYLILILGFIGFSSLLKNKFIILIFAILWFFPPIRFIDLTRFPLGVQYSLIGFSIFLINRIDFKSKKAIINHFQIFMIVLLLSASIWVSDLAIVSITSLGLTLLFYHYIKERKFKFKKSLLIYLLVGIIGNYLFIKYAKSFATAVTTNYATFNSWDTFNQGIKLLKTELFEILTFQNEEFFLSIYAWQVLISIIFLFFSQINKSLLLFEKSKRWYTFFAVDFLAIFGIILLSKWVYLNGMGRWYFVPSYISLSMLILISFDNLKLEYHNSLLAKSMLFLTVFVGAISTIHYLKYIKPKTLRSQINVRAEFLTLGEIGIIGEFWNSYISSCPDPSKIKATAHDGGVRYQNLVDEVFTQPNLYVIKDMWMKSFPDTLKQFGYILVKKSDSFKLGDCDVNKYIKIKRNDFILHNDFKYHSAVYASEDRIEIHKDSISLKNNYVVWGPYLPIGIGKFVLKYKIRTTNTLRDKPIAMFDVAANYGKTIIAKKELNIKNTLFDNDNFELEFSCNKRYTNIEFRIFFYGVADLIIENVKLVEK